MTKDERKKVTRIQILVGRAKADYQNDKSMFRADRVVPSLDEAFNLCVQLLEKYPSIQSSRAE